jgi:predicted RecA/RadA family phage recombinase
MTNQVLTGTQTSRRFCLCPSSIIAGQAVLLGGVLPAVALDSYQANEGGTTFLLNGSFNLPVYGQSVLSPPTNHAIPPGAKVYADGGTTDATTGVLYNFSLDANSSTGVLFGYVDPQYSAGILSGLAPDTAASVLLAGPGA